MCVWRGEQGGKGRGEVGWLAKSDCYWHALYLMWVGSSESSYTNGLRSSPPSCDVPGGVLLPAVVSVAVFKAVSVSSLLLFSRLHAAPRWSYRSPSPVWIVYIFEFTKSSHFSHIPQEVNLITACVSLAKHFMWLTEIAPCSSALLRSQRGRSPVRGERGLFLSTVLWIKDSLRWWLAELSWCWHPGRWPPVVKV